LSFTISFRDFAMRASSPDILGIQEGVINRVVCVIE